LSFFTFEIAGKSRQVYLRQNAVRVRVGSMLIKIRRSPLTNPSAFAANISWGRDGGVTMSRRQKPFHQPTSEYDAYLAGWAFALSVVLATLMLVAHGVHF
jgi:hypothetical protein